MKIFAVLFSLAGFCLFVLPVGGLFGAGATLELAEQYKILTANNKGYLDSDDSARDGFTYGDYELVPFRELKYHTDWKCEKDGVLIKGKEAFDVEHVVNDGQFHIYYIQRMGALFCAKDEVDQVLDYYYQNLDAQISWEKNGQVQVVETAFDGECFLELEKLMDSSENGIVQLWDYEVERKYKLVLSSKDHLFYKELGIDYAQGRYLFADAKERDEVSVDKYLSKEQEAYVRKVMESIQ